MAFELPPAVVSIMRWRETPAIFHFCSNSSVTRRTWMTELIWESVVFDLRLVAAGRAAGRQVLRFGPVEVIGAGSCFSLVGARGGENATVLRYFQPGGKRLAVVHFRLWPRPYIDPGKVRRVLRPGGREREKKNCKRAEEPSHVSLHVMAEIPPLNWRRGRAEQWERS